MNYNQSATDRFKNLLNLNSPLFRLILANVFIWFVLQLILLAGHLSQSPGSQGELLFQNSILDWIGVPASVPELMRKPWTIITYMFVHEGFWHLFFNMLWLFWFGKIFMEFSPGRKIYTVYFLGGICGALTFMLAYNVFPVFQNSIGSATTIGASASVLAITIATAVLVPSYTIHLMFIGPLKIKYIAIISVILDILQIRSGNAGGHFAHLGGAISGALYILLVRNNIPQWFGLSFLNSLRKGSFRRKPLRKVHSSNRPLTDDEYNRQKAIKQQKLDHILDKISRSGYTSLSAEEKEILFNSSKNQ